MVLQLEVDSANGYNVSQCCDFLSGDQCKKITFEKNNIRSK